MGVDKLVARSRLALHLRIPGHLDLSLPQEAARSATQQAVAQVASAAVL